MYRERYWEWYSVSEDDDDSSSETDEEAVQVNLYEERGPFMDVLRSAFRTNFLSHIFGSCLSLGFSSLMALFDRELNAGCKIGHMIAWFLGGRGGILLTMCVQSASWACGKTIGNIVTLIVVATWVGADLARFAPLPKAALLMLFVYVYQASGRFELRHLRSCLFFVIICFLLISCTYFALLCGQHDR